MRLLVLFSVLAVAFCAAFEIERRPCIAGERGCGPDSAVEAEPPRREVSPATGAVAVATDTLPFVASSRGSVYYPRDCDAWRSLSSPNLIGFASEDDARQAGYVRSTNRSCGWSSAEAAPAGSSSSSVRSPREGGSARVPPDAPCEIASVTDGDTVACADGRRIRLLLIDAPEMAQGPYGSEARRALRKMLPPGTSARVELDLQETDRYGRVLAYLSDQSGRMANEEMARLGYAIQLTYPPNVRYVERIDAAVEEARAAGRGLWSGSAFECSPRDHRAGRCER